MSNYWNEAVEQEQGPRMYFGQIFTDSFPVRILKGSPKMLFDPNQHPVDQRFIQIKIDGVCTKADGSTYTLPREMVVGLDAGWNITKASVKKLGADDPNEKWARWEMVEDGSSWNHKTTGELTKGTTFKFIEFYPDEDTCRQAEAKFYNRSDEPVTDPLDESHPMPEDTPADNGADRVAMAQFLPMLRAQNPDDVEAFYAAIASNPMVAAFFDSNSPEVVEIVKGAA